MTFFQLDRSYNYNPNRIAKRLIYLHLSVDFGCKKVYHACKFFPLQN
jgi:hypothetical protein